MKSYRGYSWELIWRDPPDILYHLSKTCWWVRFCLRSLKWYKLRVSRRKTQFRSCRMIFEKSCCYRRLLPVNDLNLAWNSWRWWAVRERPKRRDLISRKKVPDENPLPWGMLSPQSCGCTVGMHIQMVELLTRKVVWVLWVAIFVKITRNFSFCWAGVRLKSSYSFNLVQLPNYAFQRFRRLSRSKQSLKIANVNSTQIYHYWWLQHGQVSY